VPKSPFVHKKSQENFERKVHKRLIKAWDADQEVVDRWLQYVQKHAIGGVGIRIVRWERVPVGVGKRRLEDVSKEMDARAEIQALGERIVQESSRTS
jgi:small subunit ribosomal protein S10